MGLPLTFDTLTDKAYHALGEEIVTLRIPPGTVVSEAILSKRLGVGRTPVREALQRLEWEWLVIVKPRQGVIVSEIDPQRQLRLLEARREIERLLVRGAAANATPSQRTEFRQIADAMLSASDTSDDAGFMRLDRKFDELTQFAARNEFAAASMARMRGVSRRFWYTYYKTAADLTLAAQLHAAVARATANGQSDGAAAASDTLLDYLQMAARSTIG